MAHPDQKQAIPASAEDPFKHYATGIESGTNRILQGWGPTQKAAIADLTKGAALVRHIQCYKKGE